jgi:hypothetical protein
MVARPDVTADLLDQAVLAECDVWSAFQAFRSDPSYLALMLDAANGISERKAQRAPCT